MSLAETKVPEDQYSDDDIDIQEPPPIKRRAGMWSLMTGLSAEVCFLDSNNSELQRTRASLQAELDPLQQRAQDIQKRLGEIDLKLEEAEKRRKLACLNAAMTRVNEELAGAAVVCQEAEAAREKIEAKKTHLLAAIVNARENLNS